MLRYRVRMPRVEQPRETHKEAAAAAETIQTQRLRADAERPMSVSLAEGIALSHMLMGFAGAAHRTRRR